VAHASSPRGLGPRDLALALVVCLAWAGSFLFAAFALRELPPLLFAGLRLALLAVGVAPWIRLPARQQWRALLALGVFNGALNFGLSMASLKLSAGLSAPVIAQQCYVPMASLLAWWLLGERFGWRTGAGIALSFAGVLVLGFDPAVLQAPLALLLMLASASTIALGTIAMRRLQGVGALNAQGWTAVIGVAPLLLASALFEPEGLAAMRAASWVAWSGVAYSALVSSLFGYGLFYVLVQRHPVAQVTPYMLLSPVMAVLLGIVFWGDRPGPALWIGGAMVLGGVLVIALRAVTRRRPIPPPEPV
jgi:O-acetylserine/cysteine efflux transporter